MLLRGKMDGTGAPLRAQEEDEDEERCEEYEHRIKRLVSIFLVREVNRYIFGGRGGIRKMERFKDKALSDLRAILEEFDRRRLLRFEGTLQNILDQGPR